jgi:hypothetical protein
MYLFGGIVYVCFYFVEVERPTFAFEGQVVDSKFEFAMCCKVTQDECRL